MQVGERSLARFVPRGVEPRAYAVVVTAAVAQVATILWTWQLWMPRDDPPNLPIVDGLSGVDWAPLLLLLAVVTIALPRQASVLFAVVCIVASLGDQTRLQPEVFSLAFLMVVPLYGPTGVTLARWHVSSLWAWAGINKVLSAGWTHGSAGFIASSLRLDGMRPMVAVLLPACEIAVGLAGMFRRSWPLARWGGCALGLGVFVTLSPLFADWNSSVWPWVIALAISSVLLFRPEDVPSTSAVTKAVIALLVAYPALFYLGRLDAYFAHNLYTSNTAIGVVCTPSGACSDSAFDTFAALNVPLPPETRLYVQWFDKTCAPGSTLRVIGPFTRLTDPPTVEVHECARSE